MLSTWMLFPMTRKQEEGRRRRRCLVCSPDPRETTRIGLGLPINYFPMGRPGMLWPSSTSAVAAERPRCVQQEFPIFSFFLPKTKPFEFSFSY
jgi:hypothetical protein